jgi:starch phosphorylase
LTALGLQPEVCHLNEGHAAFAVLERARCLAGETGATFWQALALFCGKAGLVESATSSPPSALVGAS